MDLVQTRYEVENGVGKITLHRPDNMNAFTPVMEEELKAIIAEADRDDAVRAVVVTGAGRAYCAGADLSSGDKAFDRGAREGRFIPISEYRDGGGKVSLAIYKCRKPVIAAINGPAVGVGITMTLPMDMRIAAEDAKIGFVFARRGVVMEACSSWFLPRIVGIAKANELVFTGRVFKAADEAASGLFNHVVPRDEVLPKAMSIAREIADNTSAMSVAISKALLSHGPSEPDPQSVHLIESKCFYWAGKAGGRQEKACRVSWKKGRRNSR